MPGFSSFFTMLARCVFARKALFCFLCGLLSAFALPPLSWPVLFLTGFGGFVAALRSSTTFKQSFALGWCYAVGFHLAGLYWISASLFVDIARYVWVLPFSLLALPAYLALIVGAVATCAHGLREKPLRHAVLLSLGLCVTEINRGWLMGGFPWNTFGYIWSDTLPIIQLVSVTGIHGLTLLTLLAGAAVSLLAIPIKPSSLVALACIGALFSFTGLWGMHRLESIPISYHDHGIVRLVQPAIEQSERRTPRQRIAALSKIIALSTQTADKPVTHIIWPETASPFFLNDDEQARDTLTRLIPQGGSLITGSPSRTVENGAQKFYNSLIVMNDKGMVIGGYDKSHLVPFGEFVPLRNLLQTMPVATDVIGASDFTPGTGAKTLRAPSLPPFSAMICYEAIFSGTIVDETDRPEFLLHITNDAWFGNTSGPYQHLAMARVRAIEEGLPLLRVANSGISAVIDPLGRTVQSLGLNQRGIIDSAIPHALATPPYFTRLR